MGQRARTAGQQAVLVQAGPQTARGLIGGRVDAVLPQQIGQRRAGHALGVQQVPPQAAGQTAGLGIILLIVYTIQTINGRGIL